MLEKLVEFMPEILLFVVIPAIVLFMLGYCVYLLFLWLTRRRNGGRERSKMMDQIPISEADIKRACENWLTYRQNLGELLYFRLNAGSFVLTNPDGSFRRRVKGLPAGTSDYMVLQDINFSLTYAGQSLHSNPPAIPATRVTFLEIKKPKGSKQSEAQKEFEIEVKKHHCRYHIVRDVSQLEEVLFRR